MERGEAKQPRACSPQSLAVRLLARFWVGGIDLLFPPCCGICGAAGEFLCAACDSQLQRAESPRCSRCWQISATEICHTCQQQRSPLSGVRAPYVFDGGARALVLGLKYQSLYALAQPMGERLAAYAASTHLPADLLTPVPLHWRRGRQRGFNQAELLGRIVAERTGLELDVTSLRRSRATPHQAHQRDPNRRAENVRGAFRCSDHVAGRRVLLVDDVFTTGATLRECARTLKAAGAESVWGLTFARAD